MEGSVGMALLLTTAAGLSTVIGSVLGIIVRRPGSRMMAATLGFAAGVLIYISFAELLPNAMDELGFVGGNSALFFGIFAMFLLDYLTPHDYFGEHHGAAEEGAPVEEGTAGSGGPLEVGAGVPAEKGGPAGRSRADARLLRTGTFVAVGLAIHNFPEGLATFAATLHNPRLGVAIAIAIAIHNIPEGLAVAAPIYAATGSRRKAFGWSLLSGLAEPAGALVAAAVLYPFLNAAVLGWMLGAVGGLMVYVALDELVPASREYGHEHLSIMSAVAGMGVMALSLWLLETL